MISAVVLTHNNESTIERTLESVAWCDEVLVIDDNSTDQTVALATKLHAIIISQPLADFAQQRNVGLDAATGEWVLFVDSDEVVTADLATEITATIATTSCQGYMLHRQDSLFGTTLQFGETAHVSLLRLGRKSAGRWIRPVHEVWNITDNVGMLRNPLLHFPHPTVSEFIADINRYSTLHAQVLYQEGKKAAYWSIMAYPLAKFLQNYLVRQGFRDGMPGAVVAVMMSFHSFLARSKLYILQRNA